MSPRDGNLAMEKRRERLAAALAPCEVGIDCVFAGPLDEMPPIELGVGWRHPNGGLHAMRQMALRAWRAKTRVDQLSELDETAEGFTAYIEEHAADLIERARKAGEKAT